VDRLRGPAGDLRQHEVEEGDRRGHEDAEAQRPLARDDHARHLLVIGVPRLFDVALVDRR
jgi:hypothetical protein